MSKKVTDLYELRDSKLLYEKDVPPFGYLILVIIFALIVAVVFWGVRNTRPYVIKGSGIVESPNKNYVMSPFSGVVSNFSIQEGDYVKKGDELFAIKSSDNDVQKIQIDNQKQIYERQISQYEKLIESIKDNENYFSSSSAEDSMYYNRYEEYKLRVDQQTVDVEAFKQYGYTQEQIEKEIENNDKKKSELYYAALQDAETSKNQLQTELNSLNAQSSALNSGAEDYVVKANTSGTIHMLGEYKEGMVVQTAVPIASISTENDEFYISANIPASDRSRIKEGNNVSIEVAGLQQNIYGTIEGKLIGIDSDVSTTDDGKAYFNVKIEPEKYYLLSNDGNKINLSPGLQSEIRITYDEITYFKYVLDALGVKG